MGKSIVIRIIFKIELIFLYHIKIIFQKISSRDGVAKPGFPAPLRPFGYQSSLQTPALVQYMESLILSGLAHQLLRYLRNLSEKVNLLAFISFPTMLLMRVRACILNWNIVVDLPEACYCQVNFLVHAHRIL